MTIPEFIDTYSDDLLYIIEARKVLLTHPFRREIKELCDASFCRLLIVFMVGSIEAMMQHWREKKGGTILDKYFTKDKRIKNSERIRSLTEAFRKAGINVDVEIFKDYLAIKYLRNTIIHARWKPPEAEWVEKRGFPLDTRKLTEEHWYKILEVNENMMMYVALTDPELKKKVRESDLIKIKMKKEEKLRPWIIKRRDLPFIIFRNLENIASEIYEWIEKAATSEKYSWSKGLSFKELEKLSDEDKRRRFYIAAKKASKRGFKGILKCRQLMEDVLFFWNLYKQETFVKNNIQQKEVETCLKVIMKLHRRKSYPEGPFISLLWTRKLPFESKKEIVKSCIRNYAGFTGSEILRSLEIGKLTYDFLPNITPVLLFLVYFPIINDEKAKTLMNDVNFILNVWKLREAWYLFVEKRMSPDVSKWSFYEKLFCELLTCKSD